MALKELEARYAKPQTRDYKLADGGGLYLLVRPTGSKLWRMKYRYEDKEKLLSSGRYPELGLADARLKRAEAKLALAAGMRRARRRRRYRSIARPVGIVLAAGAAGFGITSIYFLGAHAATQQSPSAMVSECRATDGDTIRMAQRSEGIGKTREMTKRLERAIPVWTRSAISIQASSRDDGCINRPNTRKHLNPRDQILRTPPCIRWGVHTRSFPWARVGLSG